jgi:predicted membrane metal-binding protein
MMRQRWQRFARAVVARLKRLDGWRYALVRELFTGTIASMVTAPIVAWYFGRVSLVAPIANIFASPVIAFLQPALFLALVAAERGTPFRCVSAVLCLLAAVVAWRAVRGNVGQPDKQDRR